MARVAKVKEPEVKAALYRPNSETYEAMQYIGGRQNAHDILAWLKTHDIVAAWAPATKATPEMLMVDLDKGGVGQYSSLVPVGHWLVTNTFEHHNKFRVEDPERFVKYNVRVEDSTEQTLFKFREALYKIGLTDQQITDAISETQNAGIYFRELM